MKPVRSAPGGIAARDRSLLHRLGQLGMRQFKRACRSVRVPPELVWPGTHDLLLARQRVHFTATRMRIVALCLALATIGWIPVDWWLFNGDARVVTPLAIARILAGALFLAVSVVPLRKRHGNVTFQAIGMVVGVGTAFFVFVHWWLAQVDIGHAGNGHLQYLLLPVALAAGLAIFPLTLAEAALLLAFPMAAMAIEMMHGDGSADWPYAAMLLALMVSVSVTTATCAASQLKLIVDLHHQSSRDSLTGALSRRAGISFLDGALGDAVRQNGQLTAAFVDLDHFKRLNDDFGHGEGDRILQAVAQALQVRLRPTDTLIRWGGEEFVLVFPNTTAAQAKQLLSFSTNRLALRPDGAVQTASIGIADRLADGAASWSDLVRIADERMYAAKQAGRDGIVGVPEVRQAERAAA